MGVLDRHEYRDSDKKEGSSRVAMERVSQYRLWPAAPARGGVDTDENQSIPDERSTDSLIYETLSPGFHKNPRRINCKDNNSEMGLAPQQALDSPIKTD
ncbi:MAG: hypothetical protein IPL59_07280 [Candidatus Competibacteraceae bacterium]|uniref:hypothetical protein n=1 Tax=Candidatus Contendibacter odensensis TaxID=1400860 RepID=UPI0004B5B92C|nr:hypothetical protein [Candidatus Contendobacter odensis]MBK8534935.1 hypothetical protein [Candidatus Competibacteraceae bacterium]MBK8753423.1 hypothetical protein [Candidatus Competibacteraceae bacterium]